MTIEREIPKYRCHKEVRALKIASIAYEKRLDGDAIITPDDESYAPFKVDHSWLTKHSPKAGGYYIVYKDGYKSYSPAD